MRLTIQRYSNTSGDILSNVQNFSNRNTKMGQNMQAKKKSGLGKKIHTHESKRELRLRVAFPIFLTGHMRADEENARACVRTYSKPCVILAVYSKQG